MNHWRKMRSELLSWSAVFLAAACGAATEVPRDMGAADLVGVGDAVPSAEGGADDAADVVALVGDLLAPAGEEPEVRDDVAD